MNKIASLVLNWNMERFILAHIEMLLSRVDHVLLLQCDRPLKGYKEEWGYSDIPDRSEELVRKHFPEVQIEYYKMDDNDPAMAFALAFNYGHKFLKGYDLVTRFDPDMFFTKEDWHELFTFLRKTDKLNVALDWSTNSINYHYIDDYDHGCMNQLETDPLAVNPTYDYGPLLTYPFPRYILRGDIILHHFRSWKKEPNVETAVEVAKDWMARNGVTDWISAPEEIKNMLDKKYD